MAIRAPDGANKSNLDLFPYELQIYVFYVINNIFINAYFTFLFAAIIDYQYLLLNISL